MKQTRKIRKIRNKKLFLKWLKKSHRNKYNIVHSGGKDGPKPPKDLSKELTSDKKSSKIVTSGNAVLLAGAVTLGEVAYTLASNPIVINAVLALGTGTAVFAGVASGGATVVLALVAFCVCLKIKALYSKYYVMMHVINDYMLLLQKIDTMVRIAIKMSQQYKFVIDTRDVNKSLERIFNKFDKLLSKKDIDDVSNQVKTNTDVVSTAKVNDDNVGYKQFDTNEKSEVVELPKEAIERQEGLFRKFINFTKGVKEDAKEFVQVVKLNSKEFSEELNDEVTRLGLYFSILLGELNIMLNICQMDMVGKEHTGKLIELNTSVKSDDNFKNLLISSIIYRTLQLSNIFELCKDSKSSSATKKICSPENKKEYIREIEAERKKINIVLFGKSSSSVNETLFPLYAPDPEKNEPNSGLERLRTIMRTYLEEFDEDDENNENKPQKFLDDIKKFNDNLKKQNGKLGSSSSALTGYITDGSYYIDDGEVGKAVEPSVEKAAEPSVEQDVKPTQGYNPAVQVPRLPPPPRSKFTLIKPRQTPPVNQYQGEIDAVKYYDKNYDYDGPHSRFGYPGRPGYKPPQI